MTRIKFHLELLQWHFRQPWPNTKMDFYVRQIGDFLTSVYQKRTKFSRVKISTNFILRREALQPQHAVNLARPIQALTSSLLTLRKKQRALALADPESLPVDRVPFQIICTLRVTEDRHLYRSTHTSYLGQNMALLRTVFHGAFSGRFMATSLPSQIHSY